MSEVVYDPIDVQKLPDGTVIKSLPTCGWPERYAGMRWEKRGHTIRPLSSDPFGDMSPAFLAYFRDPLPAEVCDD